MTIRLLITGAPGTGKTTLLRALVRDLERFRPVGFVTLERREKGRRIGFDLVDCAGRRAVLARVGFPGPRVGKYGVDVAGFEAFLAGIPFRDPAAGLVVIDEIGKMECLSPAFCALAGELLDGDRPVAATIALRGDAFIEGLKKRSNLRLVTVTPENRDMLRAELGLLLAERLANTG